MSLVRSVGRFSRRRRLCEERCLRPVSYTHL